MKQKNPYSFSALTLYEDCPYAYYLRYMLKIYGEKNGYAEIGGYAHELLADIITKRITIEEALNDCVYNFDDHISVMLPDKIKENKYVALCDYFGYLSENALDGYEILGVEDKCRWEVNGHKMVGIIDLLLRDKKTGEIILVDHKSSKRFLKKNGYPLKSQLKSFNRYKKQMYLYADAIEKTKGLHVDKIVWNHFLDGGVLTVIPYKQEEMDETIAWTCDIIERIRNDTEFAPSNGDYMMCHVLCDYRTGECEYVGDDDYAELS